MARTPTASLVPTCRGRLDCISTKDTLSYTIVDFLEIVHGILHLIRQLKHILRWMKLRIEDQVGTT